jgi:hypothetical protein
VLHVAEAGLERRSPDQLVDEFKERTARKLENVRCPDHRQAPRLKFHGASLREMTVQMSGCCSKLIAIANRAIAER